MNKKIVLLTLLLTSMTLSGCGLKGPLYFPAAQSRSDSAVKPDTAPANVSSTRGEKQTDSTPATDLN